MVAPIGGIMGCTCFDWQQAIRNNTKIFKKDPSYGWIMTWLELSDEGTHHTTHTYGIKISFCPFCGKKLTNN